MAIIYSYPLNQPKRDDLLIGTITYDEDAVNPVHGNPTVSFTVGSLLDLVAGQGNAQNLQQVTNIGNTTTNSIIVSNSLKVSGGYYDSSNQPGTAGQLLSSTATGTQWVNVAAQGVTSVAQSHEGDAFSVTGSPITSTGTLAIEMEGSAAQYINGLGNLITFPTIPASYVLPAATSSALGGIKIGYTNNAKNYAVELDTDSEAFVNVPWTDTPYTLPVATSSALGGVKIGYTTDATARNYAVTLDSEQMLVNVPWTDTPYSLPLAADGIRGGVQIGYTQTATRDYPVTLDNEKMLVTVPWTDTPPNPSQTITGTGSDNTDSGVLLSDSGGTVLILGDGTVITAAQTGNTITLTGTDTGITGVTLAIADSAGAPLVESIANRELTLTSAKYIGGANVGYVPEGGTGTTYLKGDGTWASIPTGLIFKGTWDARNVAEGGASDGGDPDLDGIAGAADGWLYIVSTAGSAVPNGAATTPNSWNLGDWCVYDGTNWTRVPATNAGVTSVATTDGDFVELTPTAATTGAVTITADLSAPGTKDSTTFLRGDNTWDVPVTGVTSITGQEPITIVTTGGPTATTPRIDLRYADSSAGADDNVVTACPQGESTIILTGSDTLLINDATEGSNPAVLNVVREFSLGRLKSYIQTDSITGVDGRYGLIGGGTSGQINIDVNYSTDDNVILKSYNGTNVVTVNAPAAATATQIVVVSSAAIRPGMIAIIGGVNKTVNAVPTSTTISFGGAQIGTAVSTNETINFISVLSTSKLMFNTGSGTDAFVFNNALSTIDLSLFDYTSLPGSSVFTGMTGCGGVLVGGTNGLVPLPGLTFTDVNSNSAVPVGTSETLTIPNPNGGIVAGMDIRGTNSPYTSYGKVVSVTSTTVFQCTVYVIIPANEPLTFIVDDCDKFLKSDATWAETVQTVSAVGANAGKGGIEILGTTQNPQVGVIYNGGPNIVFQANADGLDIEDADEFIRHTNRLNVKTVQRDTLADLKTYINSGSSGVASINSGTGLVNSGTAADRVINVNYQAAGSGLPANNLITGAGTTVAGNIIDDDEILVLKSTNGIVQRKKVSLLPSTTIPLVSTTADGLAPQLPAAVGGKFLKADATWDVPSYLEIGTTATTALAGNTTTITTAQANEITANTAKTGITTAQADAIVANTAKVTDTGIPAVITSGANPGVTSLYANTAAGTVRATIGAGRTDTITMPNTGPGEGGILLGETADATTGILTYTVGVDYLGANNIISTAYAGSGTIPTTAHIMWAETTGTKKVYYSDVADLPFASSSASGTVTSISALNAGVLVSASTTTPTVGINYGAAGAGGTNLILEATSKTGVAPQGSDLILISDTVNSVLEYYELDDVPGFNKVGTVTSVAVTAGTGITASVANNTTTPNITITNSAPDTGVPAILSNGTAPSLNSGITATEVRTLIGAGTSSTTGTVTSVGTTGTVSGLTLTGTVTSTGDLTLGGTLSLTSANVTDGLGYTPLESETDTLADVTGRGASTSTACSFTNTGAQQFGSSGLSDVFLGGQSGNYIRFHTSSNGNTYFDMNCGFVYWRQASSTRFEQNMTNGTFTASGDVVAFGSPSDKRLKENIKPIESALDKAMKLQGVTFDWKKSDSILSIKKDIGFIAQDVQKVAPELVRENEDGYLSMRHQGITPILLEAIKELKAEIEELKLNKCNCNK
jgi:hypothetical protein